MSACLQHNLKSLIGFNFKAASYAFIGVFFYDECLHNAQNYRSKSKLVSSLPHNLSSPLSHFCASGYSAPRDHKVVQIYKLAASMYRMKGP